MNLVHPVVGIHHDEVRGLPGESRVGVDRCVFELLPISLVLGGEQAAPRYRDVSGDGKSRVTAESSCREQRRNRPLCQLV
jgi:hypothetical protein